MRLDGRLGERLLQLLSPLLLLLLWEGATRAGWLNPQFFPPPSSIVGAFERLWARGTIQGSVLATLGRILAGFALGAAPAVALGLVLGLSRPLRLLLLPAANIIYAIPKIAILPLVLLVLGLGEASKIAVTAISVFFLVLLNTVAGVRGIDRQLLDVARDFGASRWQAYRTVALPGALPLIVAGCKLALGFALIVVVGTEFVAAGAREGVGVLIWESWQILDIEAMYVGLVLTAILGWALNLAIDEAEALLLPWRAEGRRIGGRAARQTARAEAGGGRGPLGGLQRRLCALRPPPGRLRVWWRATRPFSFTATLVPVTLGALLAARAGAGFAPPLFLMTLVGALAVHAGANMVNDYYDHVNGIDDADSLGPSGLIQRGLLTPRQMLAGGLAAFALGAALGLALAALRGPAILALGLVGLPLAFFYTGWPLRLGYRGLGEILVGVFMGPVLTLGAYFVQARAFAPGPALLSLPVALLVAAILHANNLRDADADRARGKRTVATLLGPARAAWEYHLLVLGAYAAIALLAALGVAPPAILLTLLSLPLAISLVCRVAATREPHALNGVLRQTAALHLRFGLLLIAGLLLPLLARLLPGAG